MTPEDELLIICGLYHLSDGPELVDRHVENLRVMEETAPSFRDLQFIKVRLSKIDLQLYTRGLTFATGHIQGQGPCPRIGPGMDQEVPPF